MSYGLVIAYKALMFDKVTDSYPVSLPHPGQQTSQGQNNTGAFKFIGATGAMFILLKVKATKSFIVVGNVKMGDSDAEPVR